MKRSYTPENVALLPRWLQVLIAWRMMGHVGLTMQALRTLVGAENIMTLFEEVRKHPCTYVQFCHTVDAPVWSVDQSVIYRTQVRQMHGDRYTIPDYSQPPAEIRLPPAGRRPASGDMWAHVAEVFCKEYSDKKWVTLEKMRGSTSFTRIGSRQLQTLQAIGRGEETVFSRVIPRK